MGANARLVRKFPVERNQRCQSQNQTFFALLRRTEFLAKNRPICYPCLPKATFWKCSHISLNASSQHELPFCLKVWIVLPQSIAREPAKNSVSNVHQFLLHAHHPIIPHQSTPITECFASTASSKQRNAHIECHQCLELRYRSTTEPSIVDLKTNTYKHTYCRYGHTRIPSHRHSMFSR